MSEILSNIRIRLSSLASVKRLREWISPPFLVMLLAASLLWYISKLGYTYTTELGVRAQIEEQTIELNCVVEGVGTNLLGYKLKGGVKIKIPLSELKYDEANGSIEINTPSLLNAIAVRFSDIKIVSIDTPTTFKIKKKR